MKLTKRDMSESILIIIKPNGDHHVHFPQDESLEIERKAYNGMINALTVIDNPSYVLRAFLWIERKLMSAHELAFTR